MVAYEVTVDVKASHLVAISHRASHRVRKPSLPSVNGCSHGQVQVLSTTYGVKSLMLLQHRRISKQRKQPGHDRPKQTSTTSSLRSCASRASGQNLSMTQNKIAPMTTIIRIPITSVSTATSLIAAMSVSLPTAPSVEGPMTNRSKMAPMVPAVMAAALPVPGWTPNWPTSPQ